VGVEGHVVIFTSGAGNVGILDVDLRRILSHNVFWVRDETGDSGTSGKEFVVFDVMGFGDAVERSPKIFFDRGVVLANTFVAFAVYSISGS
jgi:hypothetical protein